MSGVEYVGKPKRVDHNTYNYINKDGDVVFRLHHTDILIFRKNGVLVFNSGGWRTHTTRDRMNKYQTIARIWQEDHTWYAQHRGVTSVYKDGMMYVPDVGLTNVGNLNEQKGLLKEIRKYAELCVRKFPLPRPGGGDCWHCYMRDSKNMTMGDLNKDKTHLLSHMKEGYVVPSLVWNVLIENGCDPVGRGSAWFNTVFHEGGGSWQGKCIKKWIVTYMYRRLA
jgi:hypothetical protein